MGLNRGLAAVGAVAAAAVYVVGFRRVLRIVERPSWPPAPDAIEPDDARRAVERFSATPAKPNDVGLDYAWTVAASIEPHAEGREFFPRILAELESADSSIHILMFGWKPGDVADRFVEVLERKLAEGVPVRVIVDQFGSRPGGLSKDMFGRLVAAGAEIVVNSFMPPRRVGSLPDRRRAWTATFPGRADHRKLYVIDGRVAWTGGAGIEDHFENGEFHDVMVRVTGDLVRSAQAAFLTSFVAYGGAMPRDLATCFPEPDVPGSIPAALVQVVPGGFVAATEAARWLIDTATTQLDVMNPYLTDGDIVDRIIAAAQRGVAVRIVVSARSNNQVATAALRHRYPDLLAAGVEVWEYPGAVVHAKLIVSDGRVQFGTLNLDAWALYRDYEVAIVVSDDDVADRFRREIIDPDIARSEPGSPPVGFAERFGCRAGHALAYFV